MFGITTIATGDVAKIENAKCVMSFKKSLPCVPIFTLTENSISDSFTYTDKQKSRYIKTQIPNLIPSDWNKFLYVDSDTRLQSKDVLEIIRPLDYGFDMVIVPSESQTFWHIEENEKDHTADELEYYPLQLQCGVFAAKKNERVRRLFSNWWFEWSKFSDNDQMAFLRAYHNSPVKLWLMGYPFNSGNGTVVKHLFGVTRKDAK